MSRWPQIGALLTLVAAGLGMILMPPPAQTAALALAGLPHLAVYALGGTVLALSGTGVVRSAPGRWRVSRSAYVLLGLGAASSAIVALVNVVRLQRDIADSLGPALWIISMLLILGYTLFPRVRRIGWPSLWPDSDPRSRWTLILLLAIFAVAAGVRLPGLADLPLGINADEGDRAGSAFDVLGGQASASWFDSGWFYINMVYFRLLAVFFSVFGRDVGGGRMLSALSGIGFVGAIAWLGVRNFGWRIGLLAALLATGLGITIQHSRFLSEAAPTATLWAISIGAFLEGARSGRSWAWALAGLSGGLSLYFYPSARLWAAGAVLTVVVLVLHLRDRRLVVGVCVATIAAVVASAPFLVHLSTHEDETTRRYLQTTVLDPNNQARLPYLTPPEPLPELLALQVERTLGLFDRYPDNGGFFPTNRPLFPRPVGALALIGAFYALVRSWRDPRLAVISIWFWLGLSGVALTVETPDYLRAVGMLPSLCLVMAVPLVELLDRGVVGLWGSGVALSRRRVALGAAAAVVGLMVVVPEVVAYFNTFRTMPSEWGRVNAEGQIVATLGASGPVYSVEIEEHTVNSGWVRLLAPNAQRGRVPNPGRELPALTPVGGVLGTDTRPEMEPSEGQGLSMLLSPNPNQRPYADLLSQLYPNGTLADGGEGRQTYQIAAPAVAATRGVTLVSASGPTRVDTFGRIPAGTALPAELTWHAGIKLPRVAFFRFVASGAGYMQVRLDGQTLADGAAVDTRVSAAPGLHFLELVANVGASDQRVTLSVGSADATPTELVQAQTYALMDAPWGLLARLGRLSANQPSPADAFVDATIAMAFFEPELGGVSVPNSLIWSGSLLAPRSGVYRVAFAAEDPMHLEVDGQPVDVVSAGPDQWQNVGLGSQVRLTGGAHQVRVTLDISHTGREMARWNWVPPTQNGELDSQSSWSVVPPWVLRPDPTVAVVSAGGP